MQTLDANTVNASFVVERPGSAGLVGSAIEVVVVLEPTIEGAELD